MKQEISNTNVRINNIKLPDHNEINQERNKEKKSPDSTEWTG